MLMSVHQGEIHRENRVRLTPRELEIVRCVARGLTAKEVGQCLEVSPRTVRKHVEHIFLKMRARNNAHMVALAVSLGFIGQQEILPAPGAH